MLTSMLANKNTSPLHHLIGSQEKTDENKVGKHDAIKGAKELGSEKEEKGGKGGGRRGGVMNALTVTTSSIKQPHYTLISTHTQTHTHLHPHTHTHAHTHGSWPYPFPWSLMQLVNHNRGFWAVASKAYPADSLALITPNKHTPQRHNRMWCRSVTAASNSRLPPFIWSLGTCTCLKPICLFTASILLTELIPDKRVGSVLKCVFIYFHRALHSNIVGLWWYQRVELCLICSLSSVHRSDGQHDQIVVSNYQLWAVPVCVFVCVCVLFKKRTVYRENKLFQLWGGHMK